MTIRIRLRKGNLAVLCMGLFVLTSHASNAPAVPVAFNEQIAALLALADQSSSWPEKNIDEDVQKIFQIGTNLSEYIEPMKNLGFVYHDNQGGPNTIIFASNSIKPLSLGTRELRIIIDVDANRLITRVRGRVFLHTL